MKIRWKSRFLAAGLVLLASPLAPAQERVPGDVWTRYRTPEEAGFSSEKLAEAREVYDDLDAAAAMVIHDGAVLAAWGEIERRFMCHSVRKSFMSALWGVHVDRGEVDLSKTLADLGIDDLEPKLTEVEKRATILDLLKARSGVYRLAAYEPPQNPKPPRHSHEPGTFFCYNNWDFNTLLTIFQQEVEADFFEDFGEQIAGPIGMQDFRPRDGYLHYELDKSIHPAYPFRMTARDMARFGTLFLREGRWGETVVLSREWVERSRTPYSETGSGGGYGLLWWTEGEEVLDALGMYSALGYGGHAIDVLPGANLVLVLRVDTFEDRRVTARERKRLLRAILAARVGQAKPEPALVELPSERDGEAAVAARDLARYDFEIELPTGDVARTRLAEDGSLVMEAANRGSFDLIPLGGDRFRVDDLGREVLFLFGDDGEVSELVNEELSYLQAGQLIEGGLLEEARALLAKNARWFPDSAGAHDSLGSIEERLGHLESASESYARAVALAEASGDPNLPAYRENRDRVLAAMIGPPRPFSTAASAPDCSTIEGILDALYGAISFGPGDECDWEGIREICLPEVIFLPPPRAGAEREVTDLEGFIAGFREFIDRSNLKETGFSERIAARTTDRFGDIAHSYVVFEARLDPDGEEPGSRGLDSVQLVWIVDRWWVASITTEFERPEQPLPERFLAGAGR